MRRVVLIFVLVFVSKLALGCSCNQSINSYFLKEVKNFDVVVEGAFYQDKFFIVDKIYKGIISKDTIEIVLDSQCSQAFMEDPDRTLILGLYKSAPNAYSAPACVTSVLDVNNGKVKSKARFYNLQVRRPRIGLLCTEMRKDSFVKKLKRRF